MYPFNLINTILNVPNNKIEVSNLGYDNIMGLEFMLSTLPERDQKILHMIYAENKSLSNVADELFDFSNKERVRVLIYVAIKRLRNPSLLRYLENGLSKERYKRSHFLELSDSEKVEILKSPLCLMIYEYGMDVKIYKNLRKEKIYTIEDLYNIIKEDPKKLLKIRNIGKKGYNDIILIFNNYFGTNI